ncbi:MAG: hypothetical protein JKY26_17240 [Pseudomonas sp.]|nr:hypothetical protein [Pseudomonas sp.]
MIRAPTCQQNFTQNMDLSWKLEAGSWKLEAGSWKLEAGSWKLEAGSWKLEAGKAYDLQQGRQALALNLHQEIRLTQTTSSFKL